MPSFQIGDAPTKIALQPPASAGAPASGVVNFPVRNISARAQTGRIRVEPQGGAKPEWFAIEGAPATSPAEVEKDFDASGSHVVAVRVTPPADAQAGDYTFQLRVTAEHDPDIDFVQGPTVGFSVAPVAVAPTPSGGFPWWAVAVAAVLVLVVGGAAAFFLMQPEPEDPNLIALPALEGRSHVEAGEELAAAGFPVVFALTNEGETAGLQVVRSEPVSETRIQPESTVTLLVKSPTDGPCGSVICAFPNLVFPPEAVAKLAPENFDAKYAPALVVAQGRVSVDDARFEAIKNPPPPEPEVTRVRLPRLTGIEITRVSDILLDLGLSMEAVPVAEGAADGRVQRTIPAAPGDIAQGETVIVLFRPLPPTECKTIFCRLGPIKLSPEVLGQLRASEYRAEALQNVPVQQNQRLILTPEMLRNR